MVPIVLLSCVLPVISSAPPRFSHLSKLTVCSAVTVRSRMIFAIIRPMKKISAAPIRLGMNPAMSFSRVCTGPIAPPRLKTCRMASSPTSQMTSETILPKDSPRLEPLPV